MSCCIEQAVVNAEGSSPNMFHVPGVFFYQCLEFYRPNRCLLQPKKPTHAFLPERR